MNSSIHVVHLVSGNCHDHHAFKVDIKGGEVHFWVLGKMIIVLAIIPVNLPG